MSSFPSGVGIVVGDELIMGMRLVEGCVDGFRDGCNSMSSSARQQSQSMNDAEKLKYWVLAWKFGTLMVISPGIFE